MPAKRRKAPQYTKGKMAEIDAMWKKAMPKGGANAKQRGGKSIVAFDMVHPRDKNGKFRNR